jgi:nicotinate-nucleotide pyrophosphorylase (carboxylating)
MDHQSTREAAMPLFMPGIDPLIHLALSEDIGAGDITTGPLVSPQLQGRAVILAKEFLVVAGLDVARRVFQTLDPETDFRACCCDGDRVSPTDMVVELNGRMTTLLIGERTALNFLQRMSGVATHVRSYADALKGTRVRLVDTRKTTPGWRALEKYAVRIGGAYNHRGGLFDGVLIKDNHIAACGGIETAVFRIRNQLSHLAKIEVETSTLEEVRQALACGVDVIMLDNMNIDQIRQAASMIAGKALVEVSGGIAKENLSALARTGVDVISVGALTHSARAVDLSMKIYPPE